LISIFSFCLYILYIIYSLPSPPTFLQQDHEDKCERMLIHIQWRWWGTFKIPYLHFLTNRKSTHEDRNELCCYPLIHNMEHIFFFIWSFRSSIFFLPTA
jgi:hypothetical protein